MFLPFPELHTERLLLRKLTSSDTDVIYLLRSDPEVNKYLLREPAKSLNDAEVFINKINISIHKGESIFWGISLKDASDLIGTVCLWNISSDRLKAEAGYELLPQYYSNGLMTEAFNRVIKYGFEEMNLSSIDAYVHKENIKSIKLLERSGFNKEKEGDECLYVLKKVSL